MGAVTLDLLAHRAVEAVEQRSLALGPIPFAADLLAGRRRHRRRRSAALTVAAVALVLVVLRIAPLAPAGSGEHRPGQPDRTMTPVVATPMVVARIPVGDFPASPVVAGDSVWVANRADATVSQVDARSDQVEATVAVGPRPLAVAAGAGAIWVLGANGALTRVDPTTDLVKATIPIGEPALGTGSPETSAAAWHAAVAANDRSVWVTDPGAGELVWRVDPGRNAVAAVRTGHVPVALAAGTDEVWAANNDGTLSRIDARSARVTATIRISGGDPPHGELAIAVGAGAVWVSDSDDRLLTRINPSTERLQAPIPLRLRPGGVAATLRGVWVEDQVDGAVTRIDPRLGRAAAALRVVDTPIGALGTAGMTAGADAVWIASPQEGALLRVAPGG